jgi:hypothetical protein
LFFFGGGEGVDGSDSWLRESQLEMRKTVALNTDRFVK